MRFHIPNRTYFRIGEVAKILGVKPYVIRFWEGEFPFVAPDKASSGQRVYRKTQIEALVLVKHLLHVERFSIEGAKKRLTELRKQAKLKETIDALISNQSGPALSIGSVAMKPQLTTPSSSSAEREATGVLSARSQLSQKLQELQDLIRHPRIHGADIPGLKDIE